MEEYYFNRFYWGGCVSNIVYFYHVAIYENNQKTDLNFLEVVDKVNIIMWHNRVRKINEKIVAMFPLAYNNYYIDKRIVPIGLFRTNYKPYVGNVRTPNYKEIQNHIVEMVTMLYDPNYYLAVVNFNSFLREKSIEDYFSSFLPRNFEIKLIPISYMRTIEDVKRTAEIRSIEIKLKLNDYEEKLVRENVITDYLTLGGLFDSINETAAKLDVKTLKIHLGVGNSRNASLNIKAVLTLLQLLNIDSNKIESIKVRYKYMENNEYDTVDLKKLGQQLKDNIFENVQVINPSPESIGNEMLQLCEAHKGKIVQSYRNFLADFRPFDSKLVITEEPREENRVKFEEEKG